MDDVDNVIKPLKIFYRGRLTSVLLLLTVPYKRKYAFRVQPPGQALSGTVSVAYHLAFS